MKADLGDFSAWSEEHPHVLFVLNKTDQRDEAWRKSRANLDSKVVLAEDLLQKLL